MGNAPPVAAKSEYKELREQQALYRLKMVRDKKEGRIHKAEEEARKEHLEKFVNEFVEVVIDPVADCFKEWTGNSMLMGPPKTEGTDSDRKSNAGSVSSASERRERQLELSDKRSNAGSTSSASERRERQQELSDKRSNAGSVSSASERRERQLQR